MNICDQKYGHALAERILEYLIRNGSIGYNHYGYCGVGFVLDGDIVLYTHFDEWLSYREGTRYVPGGDYTGIIKTFDKKQDFVLWLSDQSDLSLHGSESGDSWYAGNQRITKERLLSLLARQNT